MVKFSAQNSVYLGKIEKLFSHRLSRTRLEVVGLFSAGKRTKGRLEAFPETTIWEKDFPFCPLE